MDKFFDISRKKSNSVFAPEKKPNQNKSSSQSGIFYYIIIFALIIVFIYSASSLSSSTSPKNPSSKSNSTKSTQTSNVAISESSDSSQDNSLPPQPNINPDSQSQSVKGESTNQENNQQIDQTKITLKVLNASGKSGEANKAKAILEKSGYTVSEIGTAKNIYKTTVIYFKTGEDELAKLISQSLTDYQTSTKEDSTLVGVNDILVVIGKK